MYFPTIDSIVQDTRDVQHKYKHIKTLTLSIFLVANTPKELGELRTSFIRKFRGGEPALKYNRLFVECILLKNTVARLRGRTAIRIYSLHEVDSEVMLAMEHTTAFCQHSLVSSPSLIQRITP